MWDDHEVINNFAGPIEPLMPFGRQAFAEYWPLDRGPDSRGTRRSRDSRGGDVALSSDERTIVYEFRGADSNPGDDWTSFEAPLTADAGWIDLSSPDPFATEAAFREVLADLKRLRIRGEYRSGDDASFLDNVVLERG